MEKKLTKAQLKEMEEKQNELRRLRRDTISSIENFDKDMAATIRYYKINNMTDKLAYGDKLTVDEKLTLMRRYKELKFLKPYEQYTQEDKDKAYDRDWSFVRLMMASDEERNCWGNNRRLETSLQVDDLWNDDIIWNTEQLKRYLKLAQRFGYKRIFYTNSSSGALSNITDFINFGAKVIGTCNKKGYNEKAGLILDITEVNLEEKAEEVE